jgi:hypothetical protein
MAANFRQAAGTAASVAADERGVTRSQSQIHDSPRNIRLELRAFDPVPIAPVWREKPLDRRYHLSMQFFI